jgi:hypothetical protein
VASAWLKERGAPETVVRRRDHFPAMVDDDEQRGE